MSGQEDKEFLFIFNAIRRRLWVLIICFLTPIVFVYAVTSYSPPVYESTVTLMVQPTQDKLTNEYSALIAGERLAITYSQMSKTQSVLQKVIDQLELDMNSDDLAKKIKVTTITDTQLIQFTVKDPSSKQAALIANTIAKVLAEHIQALNHERYSASLDNLETKIASLTDRIYETQIKRNSLNEQVMEQAAEITRLSTLMAQHQANLLNLQQNYHALQLTVTQVTDRLHIIEPAKIAKTSTGSLSKATVTLLFDRDLLTGGNSYSTSPIGYQLLQSYGSMLTDQSLLQEAIIQLNADIKAEDLAGRLKTDVMTGTQLIQLQVKDEDPLLAAQLADKIAKIFVEHIQIQLAEPYSDTLADIKAQTDNVTSKIEQIQADLRAPMANKVRAESEVANLDLLLAGYRSDLQTEQQNYDELISTSSKAGGDVVITGVASEPENPIENRILFAAAAAILGLLAGFLWIYLLERLGNTRIRTQQDVSNVLGIAALSTIGRLKKGSGEFVLDTTSSEVIQNDFHILGSKIRAMVLHQDLHTILVTSPESSDGKSFVTANLAAILAKSGLKVVVVDADLRQPRQHIMFSLNQDNGLSTSLTSQTGSISLQSTFVPELRVLTSGTTRKNPADVLNSPRLKKLFDDLKMDADLVLIDCPPMLPVADSTILSSNTDGVLLVLRADHTTSDAVKDAIESLGVCSSRLLGVVLNDVNDKRSHRNGYSHYTDDSEDHKTKFKIGSN